MEFKDRNWIRGKLLGQGSFGTVSLGLDSSQGRVFAVKSSASEIPTLQKEYRTLSSLNSPHIIKCLGHCYTIEQGMEVYNLFMKYCPGGSLADLLGQQHVDEGFLRRCTRDILLGLNYIHEQGLVHCDVKARNLLMDSKGNIKIADFGSAKRIGEEDGRTEFRGTPLWMAPEVIRKEEQGPASDIWALGCTVLEMATGRPPWSNEDSLLGLLHRIGFTEELPKLPASLSAMARDFLDKCLVRDPKKRWTSKQLLSHPFVDVDYGHGAPLSPTTPLDFERVQKHQNWAAESCSCSSSSCESFEDSRDRPVMSTMGLSPKERIMQLACSGQGRNHWFDQFVPPDVQWIEVRSGNPGSPKSSASISKTDLCPCPTEATTSSFSDWHPNSPSTYRRCAPNITVEQFHDDHDSSLPSSYCTETTKPSTCHASPFTVTLLGRYNPGHEYYCPNLAYTGISPFTGIQWLAIFQHKKITFKCRKYVNDVI